ncbi:MAG: isoprenylcysteine carboxylmethyltransferase family protein [Anaerolineae bacterium]|nr:isoprenylcysteine carboxylmethyltransferase family protein [Anaerolineae bacterium]
MIELLIALLLWSVFHSLMAGVAAKTWFQDTFGERTYRGLYRLLFNIIAGWTLLPILYLLATRAPNGLLWSVPMPYRLINYTVQFIGVLGALMSLWQTDVWRFMGLRQIVRFLHGEADPEPPSRFIDTGTYKVVRHPLYFFSLLILWANPVMSWLAFIASGWATIYFIVGSYLEERRLLAKFGDPYRRYQAQVPRFIPLLRGHDQPSATGK